MLYFQIAATVFPKKRTKEFCKDSAMSSIIHNCDTTFMTDRNMLPTGTIPSDIFTEKEIVDQIENSIFSQTSFDRSTDLFSPVLASSMSELQPQKNSGDNYDQKQRVHSKNGDVDKDKPCREHLMIEGQINSTKSTHCKDLTRSHKSRKKKKRDKHEEFDTVDDVMKSVSQIDRDYFVSCNKTKLSSVSSDQRKNSEVAAVCRKNSSHSEKSIYFSVDCDKPMVKKTLKDDINLGAKLAAPNQGTRNRLTRGLNWQVNREYYDQSKINLKYNSEYHSRTKSVRSGSDLAFASDDNDNISIVDGLDCETSDEESSNIIPQSMWDLHWRMCSKENRQNDKLSWEIMTDKPNKSELTNLACGRNCSSSTSKLHEVRDTSSYGVKMPFREETMEKDYTFLNEEEILENMVSVPDEQVSYLHDTMKENSTYFENDMSNAGVAIEQGGEVTSLNKTGTSNEDNDLTDMADMLQSLPGLQVRDDVKVSTGESIFIYGFKKLFSVQICCNFWFSIYCIHRRCYPVDTMDFTSLRVRHRHSV